MHNDKVILKGMRFFGYHGCLDAERALGQWFVFDLELTMDLSAAGDRDALADTLDYAGVYERVKSVAEGPPVALIETLAATVIRACFTFPQVHKVKIVVKKPQAPLGGPLDYAGVEMERSREETG